jgi:hypothetical protein
MEMNIDELVASKRPAQPPPQPDRIRDYINSKKASYSALGLDTDDDDDDEKYAAQVVSQVQAQLDQLEEHEKGSLAAAEVAEAKDDEYWNKAWVKVFGMCRAMKHLIKTLDKNNKLGGYTAWGTALENQIDDFIAQYEASEEDIND